MIANGTEGFKTVCRVDISQTRTADTVSTMRVPQHEQLFHEFLAGMKLEVWIAQNTHLRSIETFDFSLLADP